MYELPPIAAYSQQLLLSVERDIHSLHQSLLNQPRIPIKCARSAEFDQSTYASYCMKKRPVVVLSLIPSHGCATAKAESAASAIDCFLEEDMPGLSGW